MFKGFGSKYSNTYGIQQQLLKNLYEAPKDFFIVLKWNLKDITMNLRSRGFIQFGNLISNISNKIRRFTKM